MAAPTSLERAAAQSMVEGRDAGTIAGRLAPTSREAQLAGKIHKSLQEGRERQQLEALEKQGGKVVTEQERKNQIDAIGSGRERNSSTGNKVRSGNERDSSGNFDMRSETGRFGKADEASKQYQQLLQEREKALQNPEIRDKVCKALRGRLEKWGPTKDIITRLAISGGDTLVNQYLERMVLENPKFFDILDSHQGRLDSSSINVNNIPELKAEADRAKSELDAKKSERTNTNKTLKEYKDETKGVGLKYVEAEGKASTLAQNRFDAKDHLDDMQRQLDKTDPKDKDQIRILSGQVKLAQGALRKAETEFNQNQAIINRKAQLEVRQNQLTGEIDTLNKASQKAGDELFQAQTKRDSQELSYVNGVSEIIDDSAGKFVSDMAQEHLDKAKLEFDKGEAEAKTKAEKKFWKDYKDRYITASEVRRGLFRRKEPHAEWNKGNIRGDFNILFAQGEDEFFKKIGVPESMSAEDKNKVIAELIKTQHSAIGLTENQQQFLAQRFPEAIINGITENPDNQQALEILKGLSPENKNLSDKEFLAKQLARKGASGGIIGLLLALLAGVATVALGPAMAPLVLVAGSAALGGTGIFGGAKTEKTFF